MIVRYVEDPLGSPTRNVPTPAWRDFRVVYLADSLSVPLSFANESAFEQGALVTPSTRGALGQMRNCGVLSRGRERAHRMETR